MSVSGVSLSAMKLAVDPASFEFLCARVQSGSFTGVIVVMCRPGSQTVTSAFFDDLSKILDYVAGYNEPTFIVGDLNARLDRQDDPDSRKLTDLFDIYGYVVRVTEPIHVLGGLLDVVAARQDLPLPTVTVYDAGVSDADHRCFSGPFQRHDQTRPSYQLNADHGISSTSMFAETHCSRRRCADQTAGLSVHWASSLLCTIAR